MKKLSFLQLIVLIILLSVIFIFSAGQAVTFAWLSSFPDRAAQLPELEMKVIGWGLLAVIIGAFDVIIFVKFVKRYIESRKK